MIKYIFFDLDDTIFDFKKAEKIALKNTLVELNIDPTDKILSRYSEINVAQWKLMELGKLTRDEVKERRYQLLFDEFELNASAKEATSIYEEKLKIGHYFIDGAEELLKKLHGKYSLYLVSNGAIDVQNSRLDSSNIRKYFEHIFISQEIGYDKPNKKFFDICFAAIHNFNKEEAVIVGDSLSSDIQGGINAGIKTVWFNPKNEKASVSIPDYEIKTLAELLNLIVKL